MATLNIPPQAPANAVSRRLSLKDCIPRPYRSNVDPPEGFALLIENALTPSECAALLKHAESNAPNGWEQAMVNTGYGQQKLIPEIRNCGRIIIDDAAITGMLYERVRPFLEKEGVDLITNEKFPAISTGAKVSWRMVRLNERLRFLKYGPGEYFKPHRDGVYVDEATGQQSRLTFHAYLGENGPENVGGSTRFFGGSWNQETISDVEPIQGRILVFQHEKLIHSGEEMLKGLKYTVRTDVMYELLD